VIVGVDEAGRGPVLGPLVVAGVAVESDVALRHLNVRDSKKLSPEKREALAPEIEKLATWELLVIPAEEDRPDARGDVPQRLRGEAVRATHRTASSRRRPTSTPRTWTRSNSNAACSGSCVSPSMSSPSTTRTSLFPVVSAASILAKVRRDREMRGNRGRRSATRSARAIRPTRTRSRSSKSGLRKRGLCAAHADLVGHRPAAARGVPKPQARRFRRSMTMREMLEDLIRKFNAKVASDPALRAELVGLRKTVLIELKDGTKYHFTLADQRVAGLIDGGVDPADITIATDADTLRGLSSARSARSKRTPPARSNRRNARRPRALSKFF